MQKNESCAEIKVVNKRKKTMTFVKSYAAPNQKKIQWNTSSIRSTNDTANYKTKETKQLKWKNLVNVLRVQTAHSAINKHSISCWQSLTKKSAKKSRSHRKINWKVPYKDFLQYETWQTLERYERGRTKMA